MEQFYGREMVGVFDDLTAMQEAIAELGAEGFGRHQISVLGSDAAMKERFGITRLDAHTLEDNPDAPRSPNVSPQEVGVAQGVLVGGGIYTGMAAAVIASGGAMAPAAILSTVVLGAGGGLVGAALAKVLGDEYTRFFNNQVENGGMLLWVQTPGSTEEEKARRILGKHGARDIHVHDLAPGEPRSAA